MTHFVYPYILPKNPVFGWELLYSIRSIAYNFQGDYDITVIGEIPGWLKDTSVKAIQFSNNEYGLRVQSKTNQKILLAADLYPDMVLMHDDYYIINKCTKEDFTQIRRLSETLNYNSSEEGLSRFQKQIRWTYFRLKELNKPYRTNFCTHAPFYYESDKLKEIHQVFNLTSTGEYTIITENAYYNYFEVPNIPLGSFRAGYWGKSNNGIPPEAKILNHDEKGYNENQWIQTYLRKQFPYRCQHEN
jgi:hypothetical protein